jgi:predicted solute-binding protein
VIRHYILVGREVMEVPLMEWARTLERGNRHVGDDCIGDVRVSTVFLGLDVGMGWLYDTGPPLVFETMVFPDCDLIGRWATYDEAEAEHAKVVETYRAIAEILEQANRKTE